MQIIKNGAFHNSLPLFSLCACTRNNGIVPCEISCTCMQHIKKKGHSYIYQPLDEPFAPFFLFYVFFFCVSPCCNRMYILSWLCKKKHLKICKFIALRPLDIPLPRYESCIIWDSCLSFEKRTIITKKFMSKQKVFDVEQFNL